MPTQGPPHLEDNRKVLKRNQPLYRDPDPAETPLGSVPAGEKVSLVAVAGDWCKIRYGSKVGWLPKEALDF
jgi:SH3-like domain-containing protein